MFAWLKQLALVGLLLGAVIGLARAEDKKDETSASATSFTDASSAWL